MKQIGGWLLLLWAGIAQANVTLLRTHPSDSTLFLQGLEQDGQGRLLYSAGLYGQSEIGYLSPQTGQRQVIERLPPHYFAEGLTVTPHGVWQLTWQEQTAFLRDLQTLQVIKTVPYDGEGWGLAYDAQSKVLWLSNGSDRLQQRDPVSFALLGELNVQDAGIPVAQLNELEWANGFLYANVWQTMEIVKIAPTTGQVVRRYDLSPWVRDLGLTDPNAVLNGIAHLADHRFLVGGKWFPVMWEMQLAE